MILKTCSKCKERKPHSEFSKNKSSKDRLQCRCKECRSQANAQYYKENTEIIKQRKKQYRKENAEKIRKRKKQYNKQYRKENAEKIRQRKKQYQKENAEKIRKRKKQYLKNQPAAVYKIENTKTGQVYIGQTTMYKQRWLEHKSDLRHNKHDNPKLQKDYNKYGLDAFEFKIIKEFPPDTTSDVLLKEEKKRITEYNQRGKNLYNIIRESEE